ncbi:unnamed protein product, partial [Rangifer tarandus platyrhynchus]
MGASYTGSPCAPPQNKHVPYPGGGEAEGAGAAGLASCASVSSPGLSRELAVGFS